MEDVTAIVRKNTATIVVRRKVVRAVMFKLLWTRIAQQLITNSGGGFDLYQTPTDRLVDVRFAPNSDRESGLPQWVMSALPPKADMCGATRDVRFGPIADIEG
jgi:hypothetical protein